MVRHASYGWLSKLWSLFGYPIYSVPYCNGDPKRAHNFDNHPYVHIPFTCGSEQCVNGEGGVAPLPTAGREQIRPNI